MNKIDYAINNLPKCWSDINKEEIIDNLCPNDLGLEDIESCSNVYIELWDRDCEKCWNEEMESDNNAT